MDLQTLLQAPKTVAVVGLSDKPDRPSFEVASYLKSQGFTIIPVNPNIQEVLGIPAYSSLFAIPREIHVDIVDIFRRSSEVPSIVQEVINTGRAPLIWMQEGVVSQEAEEMATLHSLPIVMDRCLMKTHRSLTQK